MDKTFVSKEIDRLIHLHGHIQLLYEKVKDIKLKPTEITLNAFQVYLGIVLFFVNMYSIAVLLDSLESFVGKNLLKIFFGYGSTIYYMLLGIFVLVYPSYDLARMEINLITGKGRREKDLQKIWKENYMPALNSLMSEINQSLQKTESQIIPQKYNNTEALHQFKYYLQTGKAETLQECIELYRIYVKGQEDEKKLQFYLEAAEKAAKR